MFKSFKLRSKSNKQSLRVQEILFNAGVQWAKEEKQLYQRKRIVGAKFLVFTPTLGLRYHKNESTYLNNPLEELEYEEFLTLYGDKESFHVAITTEPSFEAVQNILLNAGFTWQSSGNTLIEYIEGINYIVSKDKVLATDYSSSVPKYTTKLYEDEYGLEELELLFNSTKETNTTTSPVLIWRESVTGGNGNIQAKSSKGIYEIIFGAISDSFYLKHNGLLITNFSTLEECKKAAETHFKFMETSSIVVPAQQMKKVAVSVVITRGAEEMLLLNSRESISLAEALGESLREIKNKYPNYSIKLWSVLEL